MKANINMISDLEQKLKQDGQAIQKQAQSRLDQLDVNQSLIQAIEADLGACPRTENLLQKSWICAIFRFLSSNKTTILLKKAKNGPKPNFPSSRFLFSDRLLVNSRQTVTNTWWYGMAAAISLTVMIWAISSTDSTQMNQPHQAQQQKVQIAAQLNFKQLSLSLEQKINQPLLDEQQAIIQDLKTLKAQLLSI